jgi:hypothetical protein
MIAGNLVRDSRLYGMIVSGISTATPRGDGVLDSGTYGIFLHFDATVRGNTALGSGAFDC